MDNTQNSTSISPALLSSFEQDGKMEAQVVDWLRNHPSTIHVSVGVKKEAEVLDVSYDYVRKCLVVEVDLPSRH